MINLMSKPVEKKGQEASQMLTAPTYDEPAYPYGLTLHLNTETLQRLGVTELPQVGTKVRIVAIAEVSSVSRNMERDGDERRELGLQVQDMEPLAFAGAKMYDKSDMKS